MTPELVERAAFWQARLLSDQCSDRDRAQFTTWLGESDAHHQAYGLVTQIWASNSFSRPQRGRALSRRHAVAGAAFLGLGAFFAPASADARIIRTGRHERRRIDFGDLTIDMDACSSVTAGPVRGALGIGEGRCAIGLASGVRQVSFRCADWRMSGTRGRYALDVSKTLMTVAVIEGALELQRNGGDRVALSEGQVLNYEFQTGRISRPDTRLDDLTAWREGRAVFRGSRLDQAVAEMTRYCDRPVRLLSPSLAGQRISGVFHTQDPIRFFKALTHLLPVRVSFDPGQIGIVKL